MSVQLCHIATLKSTYNETQVLQKKTTPSPVIFKTTVYLQSFVLHIALGINPKTSGQGHYVQLPFNKQGFQQSLAAQTTNNHYYCKPTPPPPTPQKLAGLYWLLKGQQLMITLFVNAFL
jgi:hypothetical protein